MAELVSEVPPRAAETLETERLRLRPFRDSDLDAYAGICADGEVMRYLGGAPLSRDDAWRQIAFFAGHWQLRGYGMWAVEELATGDLVGRVGYLYPEGWPDFELGWTLGRSHWGRGFATEAGRVALDHAFERLGRDRVISLINPRNRRSIAVAGRLGARAGERTIVRGTEVVIYGIDRADWERSRP